MALPTITPAQTSDTVPKNTNYNLNFTIAAPATGDTYSETDPLTDSGALGAGKVHKATLDLSKFSTITSFTVTGV